MENTTTNTTPPAKLRDLAIAIAKTQIGQEESPKGSNSGVMVDVYLKSVGLNPGYAWCAAFVFYCYSKAAIVGAVANPVVKTAGVLNLWNKTAVNFKIGRDEAVKNPGLILPGYQFCIKHGTTTGHTGLVESVDVKNGIIHTIEGNSNNNGSREGTAVVRHERKISEISLGFIKY